MPVVAISSMRRTLVRMLRDKSGASATVVAIALPGLIGFGALGAETGVWFTIKLQNQSAADAAAVAIAWEVLAGKTDVAGELTSAATEATTQNGYNGTTPAIVYPYTDTIVANAAAVTLQQTQGALLAAMFLRGVTITTKAVAVIERLDNACVLALGTGGTDVAIAASTRLNMPDCAAVANSTGANAMALQDSTSSITAATVVAAGEISLQGSPIDPGAPPPQLTLTSRAMIGAPSVSDPYGTMITHTFLTAGIPAAATEPHSWNSAKTIYPGLYDKGMSFGSNAVVTLTSGVYYVTNGDFSVAPSAKVTGHGVTIILTTTNTTGGTVGNVNISAGSGVTLEAPNTGAFSGLLFLQDPLAVSSGGTTPNNLLGGGSIMALTGLLYFPKTSVDFAGNPSATCTSLVASWLEIIGDSSFASSGCVSSGVTVLPAVNTVALAE